MRAVKPVQKVVCPNPSHIRREIQYDHGRDVVTPREHSLISFISFSQPRKGMIHSAPVPLTTSAPDRGPDSQNCLQNSFQLQLRFNLLVHMWQRRCSSYLMPGEEKSSLVIPVKMWIKRIAGVILRRWRSPQTGFSRCNKSRCLNTELRAAAVSSVSNFHTVWCYYSSFLHLSFLPSSSVIGGFQSFSRFGVIWSTGAVGSRCGDKKRQGWQDWEESRLIVWPRMERPASRKSIK